MKADKRKFSHEPKLVMPFGKTIDFRPEEVAGRSTPLHWEMDTVYSAKGSLPCLLTLTERKTLLEVIKPMRNRTQASLSTVWRVSQKDMEVKNFKEVFKSITVDNGMEFRDFAMIEKSIYSDNKVTSVYFAHPYRSGERGSNENQNRMIRRKIPKGDNIGLYSDKEIKEYTRWLNTYPRKKFKGKSSYDMMCEEYRLGNISQSAFVKLMKLACCDCETLPNLLI